MSRWSASCAKRSAPCPRRLGQRHRGDRPLTSPALAQAVQSLTGEAELAFFDAIAPIVHRDTIDMSVCWLQSRYDKEGPGGGDRRLHQLPARQSSI